MLALFLLPACAKKLNMNLSSANSFPMNPDSMYAYPDEITPPWAPKVFTYKPSAERIWDLIHTKLEISPDWKKQQLKGTATLTLEPYFYPQDSLKLDARGFEIYSIKAFRGSSLLNSQFNYDGLKIHLSTGTTFKKGESLTLIIDYLAKPTELPDGGSAAITDDQGMYFINADGSKPGLPQQIWTQGETQGARCWFPTIDEPNEKSTQEMYITVENRYKTLSNGILTKSVKKDNGLRTDVWEMKQPHAPYLFMMAVGEYEVISDSWGKLPLHYWVEPKYKSTAKKIFGRTPAMIDFFSKLLDYPFPWPKYDQIVVRNFVSGAMENTSASVFMENLQSTPKELVDRNWDDIIAHELFHQWFGDLVTLESWANLPLNESFANYSEYLWLEHHQGRDAADLAGLSEKQQYLYESMRKNEPLIRYHHDRPDDMFDSHSYAKGGRILHMLRKELGDDAFFEALKLYLKKHAYKTVEVHDLRLAMEEVSGRDLNWFFNQWFLKPGHPELKTEVSHSGNTLQINVIQNQDTAYFPVYRIDMPVDIRSGGQTQRVILPIRQLNDTFRIPIPKKPDMVLFDAEASILCQIETSDSLASLENQYRFSNLGIHRYKALQELKSQTLDTRESMEFWSKALKDSFWPCREIAVERFSQFDSTLVSGKLNEFQHLALKDPHPSVRKAALELLSGFKFSEKKSVLESSIRDSSMAVSSEGLRQYFSQSYPDATQIRMELEKDTINSYHEVICRFYENNPGSASFSWFEENLSGKSNSKISYEVIRSFGRYLEKESDETRRQEGISLITNLASEGTEAGQVIGAYQVLKELSGIPDAELKRKQIREKHRNDDFFEILEYLD